MFVSQSVSPSLRLARLGQLLRNADKRIVNIMKLYNLQVELMRFRKNIYFVHVYFFEARNSMQYRPPNANLVRSCQVVFIVTGDN